MPEQAGTTDAAPEDAAAATGANGTPDAAAPRAAAIALKLLPIALILVVCIGAVSIHVSEYRHLGPLDEQAHLDYVNRILSGHLPAVGDKVGDATRRQVACRGLETPVGFGDHPDCRARRTNRLLPEQGNAYEAGQPPLYYAVTAALSKISPGDDIDSIRWTGGLWLAAGAVALYLTLRRLAVGQVYATVVTLALALTPPLLVGASVVSNDIGVFTFGAVGLWAVVRLMQVPTLRYPHLLIGAAIGIVGALIKPSALLIVIAFAMCVVLQQWWIGRRNWGLLLGGSMLAGAAVATGAWGLIATSIQHEPLNHVEPWARYRISSLNLDQLFKQPLFNLVTPLRAFVPAAWRGDWVLDVLLQTAIYAQIGLLLLPVLARWPTDVSRSVGVAYLTVVAVSGPYYVIVYFVATRILYGADTRFAFGLIPLMAVVLVAWVPHAWQRWLIAGVIALPSLWYVLLVSGAVTAATR